jgi:hypothetical protein
MRTLLARYKKTAVAAAGGAVQVLVDVQPFVHGRAAAVVAAALALATVLGVGKVRNATAPGYALVRVGKW